LTPHDAEHFDVLIVGAGLSGIGAGYHLQQKCPGKSYVILEGRDCIGGTWDLFRYPGIRSDSDMFTLGYSFKPWTEAKAIADGPRILNYVRETAADNGIDKKIRYHHRVKRASWSSPEARWTVEAERTVGEGATEIVSFTCNFLFMCSGYYKYEEGYTPEFYGRDRFRRPDRASAEMARRSRLRGKARGGDRLGRDRRDAGAGDGQDRRSRHHAAALADLCGVAPGATQGRQQIARAVCLQNSPIF
jgi:cation diffusion facilitator CzcD-associated flavoprotein CzcO